MWQAIDGGDCAALVKAITAFDEEDTAAAASSGSSSGWIRRRAEAWLEEGCPGHPSAPTPLMSAASAGRADMVGALLTLGAGVDTQSCITGYSALHCAAYRGHVEVVRLLRSWGANPLLQNSKKETCFQAAQAAALSPSLLAKVTEALRQ